MATFEIKGLKELQTHLGNASQASFAKMNTACKKGADLVLQSQKAEAPKDTGEGANALSIVACRTGKGFCFYDVGINSTNWEQTKQLWFHNFGYYNHWTNTRICIHVGWFQKALNQCKQQVQSELLRAGRAMVEDILS